MRWLRPSFAGKMLIAGLVLASFLIMSVAGLFLLTQQTTTNDTALNSANNSASLAGQLLTQFQGIQEDTVASDLAREFRLIDLLNSDQGKGTTTESKDLSDLVAANSSFIPSRVADSNLIEILDANQDVVYTTNGTGVNIVAPTAGQTSAHWIFSCTNNSGSCKTPVASGISGMQQLPDDKGVPQEVYVVSQPVIAPAALTGTGRELVGAVVLVSPIGSFVLQLCDAVGDPVVFLNSQNLLRYTQQGSARCTPQAATATASAAPSSAAARANSLATSTVLVQSFAIPSAITCQAAGNCKAPDANVAPNVTNYRAIYNTPYGLVAGSFAPVCGPSDPTYAAGNAQTTSCTRKHAATAGYMGAEVPLSAFTQEQQATTTTVLWLAASALFLTAVAILLFVDRFVQRPVRSLDKGVSRIAAGDYATPVRVRSHDELGRLAGSVNKMREQIASYIRHVDQSVERLEDVSRALTSTTSGVALLQDSVLQAAIGMAGEGSSAALLLKQGEDQMVEHAHQGSVHSDALLQDSEAVRTLFLGQTVRQELPEANLVAIPMTYQEQVTGGLVVALPPNRHLTDVDESALTTLAHNAIVAMENTRLFEQEKQTVERLRELDKLKNDFVSNAQHELRTPIAAITNNLELITIAWDQWDDAMKKETLKGIDSSTRAMGEIVETLIDMSLLSETVPLKLVSVNVKQAVDQAIEAISLHRPDGIKVPIQIGVPADLAVTADQKRFLQTVRALVDNSVKFTSDTGRIEIRAAAGDDGNCTIDILDNGIGIPEEAIPHIFEPFYQANSAKTRTFGGMGMGLALVKRLVEVQGATIEVQSVVDRGTMVRLHWPVAAATTNPEDFEKDSFHMAKTRF